MGQAIIRPQHLDTGAVSIELAGHIDSDGVDTLRHTLITVLMYHRPTQIVVDTRAVTTIDSTGVGCLLAAAEAASDLGITFTITAPGDQSDPPAETAPTVVIP
jgi:anti-anti-sigma factor